MIYINTGVINVGYINRVIPTQAISTRVISTEAMSTWIILTLVIYVMARRLYIIAIGKSLLAQVLFTAEDRKSLLL